jgi:hypothetical protein
MATVISQKERFLIQEADKLARSRYEYLTDMEWMNETKTWKIAATFWDQLLKKQGTKPSNRSGTPKVFRHAAGGSCWSITTASLGYSRPVVLFWEVKLIILMEPYLYL